MADLQVADVKALTAQNDELWKEAYDKFRSKDSELYNKLQDIIRKDSGIKKDVGEEQQLGDLLARKWKTMEDRQWTLHWTTKAFKIEPIKVGPLVQKIIKVFQVIKPIGDAAATLDPIHAGIPWACVSVLLPLILNYGEEHELAMKGLLEIVMTVQQFSSFSWAYLHSPASEEKPIHQLKDSIVTLYWKILRYEAVAIRHFSRNTIVRYAAATIRKDGWKDLCDDVVHDRDSFLRVLLLNDSQEQRNFQSEVMKLILALDKSDEENQRIVQWVSDKAYTSRHSNVRQLLKQYSGAGEWIIERYLTWLDSAGSPVFWVRGTIGTGKSSIMSGIIESFYSGTARQDGHRMIYFYCVSPETKDDVIRSLVAQLAWKLNGTSIDELVDTLFKNAKPPYNILPTPDDWYKALLKLCERLTKVVIVIDALDECVDFSGLLVALKKLRGELLESKKGSTEVKFVLSSRMNVMINRPSLFPITGGVSLTREDTLKDMGSFLESEVRSREDDFECEEELKRPLSDRVVKVLSQRAGGMFQWVILQLGVLFPRDEQVIYPENINGWLDQLEVQNIPLEESLNKAYEKVYSMNVKPGLWNKKVNEAMYKWLLGCRRSLPTGKVLQLIMLALQHDPQLKKPLSPLTEDAVLHICSNFITRDSEGTFQFAHLSVREYLEFYYWDYQQDECHLFIMQTCLTLLSTKAIEASKSSQGSERGLWWDGRQKNSFETYAILYWANHSNNCGSAKRTNDLGYQKFILRNKITPALQSWYLQLRKGDWTLPLGERIGVLEHWNRSEVSLVRLGAAFDLVEVIEVAIVKHGKNIDDEALGGLTPLLIAIRYRCPDAVKYLLDQRSEASTTTHLHPVKYVGMPIRAEDLVKWLYWDDSGRHEEEVSRIEATLLEHQQSSETFLLQTTQNLSQNTHPKPSKGLKILYEAGHGNLLSAKTFPYRIQDYGLGDLVEGLEYFDNQTFDQDLIINILNHDNEETIGKFLEYIEFDEVTELFWESALKGSQSSALQYFMTHFNHDTVTQAMVIHAMPLFGSVWEVLLDRKEKDFVTQEVFDALFQVDAGSPYYWTIKKILGLCGPGMITSAHLEVIVAWNNWCTIEILEIFKEERGSLNGLISEAAMVKAVELRASETAKFLLANSDDAQLLLTEKVLELAEKKEDAVTELIRERSKSTEPATTLRFPA